MKKIKLILGLFGVIFLTFIKSVEADSIIFKGDKEFSGNEFSVILEISSEKNVAGIQFPFKWDSDKVEIEPSFVNDEANENFNSLALESIYNLTLPAKNGGNLLLDSTKTKTGTFEAIKIIVKAKDDFKVGETTTLTLEDGIFADLSGNDWAIEGTSITIKRVEATTNSGDDNKTNTDNKVEEKEEKEKNPTTGSAIPIVLVLSLSIGAVIIAVKKKSMKKLYKI